MPVLPDKINKNQMLISLGENRWKLVTFVEVALSKQDIDFLKGQGLDNERIGNTKTVIDDAKTIYDDSTQNEIDNNNIKTQQINLLLENTKLKINNEDLKKGQLNLLLKNTQMEKENKQAQMSLLLQITQLQKDGK
ncbi:hypothetical protein [Apilactobacillus xinyiensis]|uniref:hypothetical protein n=1 Tax=Apilactobacillus xinyiensis TaxID=2841032 RepID=UPI003364F7AA